MDEYKRAELDGVPVVWVPHSGSHMVGGITFRSGMADEPFARRGITHLIEHLALSRLDAHYEYNGYVDAITTSFHAKGSPEEVSEFLSHVCISLGHLPYERLDTEIRILEAEGASRGISAYASGLNALFGTNHFGMLAVPEVALDHASPEMIEDWRMRRFTRENAIVWMAGPEPPSVSFAALPHGERLRPTGPLRLLPNTPMVFHVASGGPAVLNVVERGVEAQAVFAIAAQRLEERMRSTDGLSYSVQTQVEVVNARYQVMGIYSDCTPENSENARGTMAAELHRMMFDGVTQHEIADYAMRLERAFSDDNAAFGRAMNTAHNLLIGHRQNTEQETLDRARALSPADCTRILRSFLSGCLWTVPMQTAVGDRRFGQLPAFSTTRATAQPIESIYTDHSLSVDAERLSVVTAEGHAVTIALDDIVGARLWTDGAWTFWNIEGFVLSVVPTDYPGGPQAIAQFTDQLDQATIVRSPLPFRSDDVLAQLQPKAQVEDTKPSGLLSKLAATS